jgi:cysteinyl-tRNA synthetase
MLRIHNSLTGVKEEFKPLVPNQVRMYVCGMTNYDYIHVGHARMLTVFDLVQRYLRSLGYAVTYVRNVTDIDDKIIERAAANGENWAALARRFTAAMHEDCAVLGLQEPDLEPRATEYIGPIIAMTQTLVDKSYAYVSGSGDVMYSVRKFAKYGQLSGKKIDAGRTLLGFPVGAGSSRLAHRMLCHVDESARELFRYTRRRRGLEVSAPRE